MCLNADTDTPEYFHDVISGSTIAARLRLFPVKLATQFWWKGVG